MRQRLLRMVRDLSLKKKILALLLLALVPLILAAWAGLNAVTGVYSRLLYQAMAAQLSYSAQQISSQLESVETLSGVIFAHDAVQRGLQTLRWSQDNMARTDANLRIRTLLINYYGNYRSDHIRYIDLFADNLDISGSSYYSRQTPAQVHEAVRAAAHTVPGSPVWVSEYSGENGLFLGRVVRRIENLSFDELGELVICVDINAMVEDATRFGNAFTAADYLILDGDGLLYHSPAMSDDQAGQISARLTGGYCLLSLDTGDFFAVRGRLGYEDWSYICLVACDEVTNSLQRARAVFVAVLVLAAVLVFLLALRLVNSLDRHLQNLVAKMAAVGGNDQTLSSAGPDYSERGDEIGILHQQFDKMTAQLRELIQTNYVNELLKREAQVKSLENQINPHFLYNTLESVNWRAKALGAEDISVMVQALGAMLRVTLSGPNEAFTVDQELSLVRNYMTIQAFRYEDRLEFSFEVPAALRAAAIPKLTLQPLVENAIYYGLEENTETCSISITARQTGADIEITVRNSGSQFEPDLLPKLRSGQVVPRGHGIGLLNIDQRLKLTFGEAYGLTLYNDGEQAAAMVTIPSQKEDAACSRSLSQTTNASSARQSPA